METETSNIGQVCVKIALRAACAYLKEHKLTADDEPLFACVRSWCEIKLPEAITDYKDACDCGMEQIGQKSFLATMALAGIEAAKEAGKSN